MKFKTTKEDYDIAVKEVLAGGCLDDCCLLTQTLKRTMPGHNVKVSTMSAWVDGTSFELPDPAKQAVLLFDMSFSNLLREDLVQVQDGYTELEFELPIEET